MSRLWLQLFWHVQRLPFRSHNFKNIQSAWYVRESSMKKQLDGDGDEHISQNEDPFTPGKSGQDVDRRLRCLRIGAEGVVDHFEPLVVKY